MDPDHGLFAHQNKGFDLYSASKDNPMSIREQVLDNGRGWTVTSQVDSKYELLQRNEEQLIQSQSQEGKSGQKGQKRKFDSEKNTDNGDVVKATTTFVAPNLVVMGRRDKNNETSSITCFFVTVRAETLLTLQHYTQINNHHC